MWTILGLALSGSIAFGGSIVEPSCQLEEREASDNGQSLTLACNKEVTPPLVSLEKVELVSANSPLKTGLLYTMTYP